MVNKLQCDTCGKEINRNASKILAHKHHYCSLECRDKGHRKDVVCQWCGKTINRHLSHAKREQNNFCNRECMSEWKKAKHPLCLVCGKDCRQKKDNGRKSKGNRFCSLQCWGVWKTTAIEVECFFCGKPLKRTLSAIQNSKHVFCDQKCSSEWKKTQVGILSARWEGAKEEVPCDYCGNRIMRERCRRQTSKHHFCDMNCYTEWQKENLSGSNSPLWQGGPTSRKYYGPNWKQQRKAALERDNYCCQACGACHKGEGKKFNVHHIIPIKHFGFIPRENDKYIEANDLSNLVSLCLHCHRKVETGNLVLWRSGLTKG